MMPMMRAGRQKPLMTARHCHARQLQSWRRLAPSRVRWLLLLLLLLLLLQRLLLLVVALLLLMVLLLP